MEVDTNILDQFEQVEYKRLQEESQNQQKEEQQKANDFSLENNLDLSNLKPLVHNIHKIIFDMLNKVPDDSLLDPLDDELIKVLEYYAPFLMKFEKEWLLITSYLGTFGIVLMASKNKEKVIDVKQSGGKEENV